MFFCLSDLVLVQKVIESDDKVNTYGFLEIQINILDMN